MPLERQQLIRLLFEEYIEMYAARDERLLQRFSDHFSGYTGSGHRLITRRSDWLDLVRHDFALVPERIGIEMLDLALQDLSDDVVMVTAFFHIHLPAPGSPLAREIARQVLVFRREGDDWKIAHSGISVPLLDDRSRGPGWTAPLQARVDALEAQLRDRTQALEASERTAQALSQVDVLTGVSNQRHFEQLLQRAWEQGQRKATPLALILLEVDHFPQFSVHYGRLAADACLQTLALTLVQLCPGGQGEQIARWGPGAFGLLLTDTGMPEATALAQRIQAALGALALPHAGAPLGQLGFSLGVASLVPEAGQTAQALVRRADLALCQSRQAGPNGMALRTD